MWESSDNQDADGDIERPARVWEHATSAEPRCAQIEPLLQAAHEEPLDAVELERLLAHIATCAHCGPRFEQRLDSVYALARTAPEVEPPPAIERRLYARITSAQRSPLGVIHATRKAIRPMRDVDDPIASAEQPARPPTRPARRYGVWIGAVAALLVVGLLGTVFLTLAHTRSRSPGGLPAPQTACAATTITAQLPSHVYVSDLAMTSTTEGWAVGAQFGAPVGVLFHYQQCHWTALPQRYTGVVLGSVSMVSATEGWAVGGSPSRSDQPFALHYTGGEWQQVAIPLPSGSGAFITVRMLNANEGWILATPSKLLGFNNVLLHYRNGAWTPVALPFSSITDIAPVGADDLWIASGSTETPLPNSELAHYQAGTWSSVSAPAGVTLSHLRANAPTDIYAMGSVQAASGVASDATPADLHYDGSTWTRLPLTGRGVGQMVEMLSATDGWAFQWERTDAASSDYIARADHLTGATAQPTALPTNDLNFIKAITPMPDGSYWAIGGYMVKTPSEHAGYSASLFLRYAEGVWSQYGHV